MLGNHSPPLPMQELSIAAPEKQKTMEGKEVRDLEVNEEREIGTKGERKLVLAPKYLLLIGFVKKIQHSADPVGMGPTRQSTNIKNVSLLHRNIFKN